MSVETRLHLISPEFAEAIARAPELMTRWTGRSEPGGIDPAAFVAHPKVIELAGALRVPHVASWDDGTSLGPWLEGIVFLLKKRFPDEADTWATLLGTPNAEFPLVQSPDRQSVSFSPVLARRLAGILNVQGTFRFEKAYDPAELKAARLRPMTWDEVESLGGVMTAFQTLCSTLDRAAKNGRALIIEVTL